METFCSFEEVVHFMTGAEVDTNTYPDVEYVNTNIRLAAAEIHAALNASDQGSCARDEWADTFLNLLNLIGAVLLTEQDNLRQLTDADLSRYQDWKNDLLNKIRTGEMAICSGETNKDYPAFSTAPQSWTPEAAANIIRNRIQKESAI